MEMPKRISRLPNIDKCNAELTNALLVLLGSEFDEVRADNGASLHSGAGIFGTARGTYFQLLDSSGSPLIGASQDAEAVCDALDAADPLLFLIEQKLEASFDAETLTAELPFIGDAIVVFVSGQGLAVALVIAATDDQAAEWIMRANAQPIRPEDIPVCLGLELAGARLSLSEVEGIDSGDLLLLPKQLAACLEASIVSNAGKMADPINGLFNMKAGQFSCRSNGDAEEQTQNMSIDEDASSDFSGLKVPVMIRMPDQNIDAATLAALRPGSNLVLGPVVQGMQVILSVGGKEIARGEMVEIGDNFAVHIDRRSGLSGTGQANLETGEE